jgi:peptidoglycan/xylan/chitin deacetylase (PgdA/CDA1 family)
LEAHVSRLHRSGYVGLTFADSERRRSAGTLPRKWVAVTFDDGFASTLRAKPILDRVGFPATVAVVTRFVESGEPLRWLGIDDATEAHQDELLPLTWDQLETLAESGWEVASHTASHPVLTRLGEEELARELGSPRTSIVSRFGACETVAYPYGLADERVAAAAKRAGYIAGSMLTGAHLVDEPYRRQRVGLSAADQGLRLRLQLSPAGLALRRSPLAKLVRRCHGRRDWLPPEPE